MLDRGNHQLGACSHVKVVNPYLTVCFEAKTF